MAYITQMTSKIIARLMARANRVGLTKIAKFQPTNYFFYGTLENKSIDGHGLYAFTMRNGLGVTGYDLAQYAQSMGLTVRSWGLHGSEQYGSVYVTYDIPTDYCKQAYK